MGFIAKLFFALAIVSGGVWAYMNFAPQAQQATTAQTQSGMHANQQVQVATSDSSDAALEAQLKALDADLQATQSASADVDTSFNDKPIAQTE